MGIRKLPVRVTKALRIIRIAVCLMLMVGYAKAERAWEKHHDPTPDPTPITLDIDPVIKYANYLTSHFLTGGVCDMLAQQMKIAADPHRNGQPANIRTMMVDKYLDAADRARCVMY